MLLADTHTAVWYLTKDQRLSQGATEALHSVFARGRQVYLSAITLIELVYLAEKGRVSEKLLARVESSVGKPPEPFEIVAVNEEVARALKHVPREQVPDMPDRILAATSLVLQTPLVTRDGNLQRCEHITTIW